MIDAIITAGGIPQPGEPLYPVTLGKNKAMLDVCGKPMIQWVLDALDQAETVDRVIIIGLPSDSGVRSAKVQAYLPNQGTMLANLRAGMDKVKEINPQAEFLLTVSSDIPGIQAHMVDWCVRNALESDHDLYYHVIEQEVMEKRYPGSKRSYTHLKDTVVCGGDMNLVRIMTGTENDPLWNRLIETRKNVFKQASVIGWDTLFLLLTRQATLQQAVKLASSRLHLRGKAVVCPYAEIGMDVDKPFQLEIVSADLAAQQASGAA